MKKSRSCPRLSSFIVAALSSAPGTALALGGEGIAEGALLLLFWFIVWILSFGASFAFRTTRKSRYILWAIRLSLPSVLLYFFYVAPYFEGRREASSEVARQAFSDACNIHVPHATQILHLAENDSPKRLFVDNSPELAHLRIGYNLAECIAWQAPACRGMKLESIGWVEFGAYRICKHGIKPGTNQCLEEYKQVELSEKNFSVHDIDQPAADYVVRVKEGTKSGEGYNEIRKIQISLIVNETGQPLARTEILVNDLVDTPCPIPAEEVARMIMRLFPQK